MRTKLLISLVVGALLVAACGDGDDRADGPTTTTIAPSGLAVTVDWAQRTVEVGGSTTFEVEFCEGEAPLLCIGEGDRHLGVVELGWFEPVDDLHVWAAEHYEVIAEDRRAGCSPDYVLEGDDLVAAPFGGSTGVRYGFSGTIDGREVERVVGYAVVVDGTFYVLTANALADDGCLARESELPIEVIDRLEPVLAAVAAGTTLPGRVGEPLADGTHSGYLDAVHPDARIVLDPAVMLSGEEAVAAAEADGQLPPDGSLPNDFYIDDLPGGPRELVMATDAVVELYDCTAGCELRTVPLADLLDGSAVPFNGERALVEVELRAGEVVSLREIYFP